MPKNVISIGVEIPGADIQYAQLSAKLSLLDYDIAIINPNIYEFYGSYGEYLGKPSLSDSNSFKLKEQMEHWRREILEAVNAGKTIFVLLNEHQEVYVATGQKTFSGTGRNRETTRIVELYSNYNVIPGTLDIIDSKGTSMILYGKDKDNILASYWSEMGKVSEFRVFIDGQGVKPLIVTKSGEKTVGAYLRYENAAGALVLLPYIDFERDSFTYEKKETIYWTKEARKVGAQFISAIVGVDKVIKQEESITPTPDWAAQDIYMLSEEQKIGDELLKIETRIEALRKQKEQNQQKLAEENRLKGLLFEKGKPLEYAVHKALRLLGFTTSQYRDADSEFDVVFESQEGRLIGEAEGKDNKSVNVDKLRQLEMNIHEDFSREGITEMAKGVLIGNAYRLSDPVTRGDYFTEKCLTAANRSKTALIRSTDLFYAAKYLSESKNDVFACKCREAILATVGIVRFPEIPENDSSITEKVTVDKKS